ncbi:carbon monoxide dehydrogenase [Mycobacterium sp. ACS1612]|uniref:FAD binding domain-containing protein n=1 Tax=Mycobacterium sp. ACS1612 TaxID=1834117 RepID=UPI0007FF9F26|nr:xanthine dehydrogenase family protein subunit M [Mycobacterium sp. ACS1612]OBF29898.1 carbon monoxide dehydrogenase [Mycobacterium sp. ACS1612]
MKPAAFDYHCPGDLTEAIGLLQQHGDEAKVLAGGQSLIPLLSLRLSRFEHLIDMRAIADLRGITAQNGSVRVAAMTTQSAVARSDDAAAVPLLAKATSHIGHYQIRNRGTVGGSLAHADPAAEYPAVALALDASLEVAGPTGRRSIPASDFFRSTWTTAVEPDEVLVAAQFPVWPGSCGWAVAEVARRAGDFAMCGAVCGVQLDGQRVSKAALALFGVDSVPVRAQTVEAAVTGSAVDDLDLAELGAELASTLDPPDDLHASGQQRKRMAKTLVPQVLAAAIDEAKHA